MNRCVGDITKTSNSSHIKTSYRHGLKAATQKENNNLYKVLKYYAQHYDTYILHNTQLYQVSVHARACDMEMKPYSLLSFEAHSNSIITSM